MLLRNILNRYPIKTTIIVPLFGDLFSIKKNLESLKKNISSDSNVNVLYVNDCGPEVDKIEEYLLSEIENDNRFSYHRNEKNLGFVRNCNIAALELTPKDHDIILLNSDTIVTNGFIEQLRKVAYSSRKIAAVCPRSNAATIFSVPINNKDMDMDDSYRLYSDIKDGLPDYYLSPIAHGFCMFIKRSVINKYGLFDEVYGKGYGEENDFCMRVHRQGYICAVANKAYVYHYKARSFTEERRSLLVDKNEKILYERYPEYVNLISKYIDDHSNFETNLIKSLK